MKKAELIFFPSRGIGHLVSTVELAQRLVERDDRLSATVLTLPATATSPYTESLDSTLTQVRLISLPRVDLSGMENLSGESFISQFMDRHITFVKDAITQRISTDSVRLAGLVVDLFSTTIVDLADELGIPAYLYFTSGAAMLGVMLHLPNLVTDITEDLKDYPGELVIPSFVNSVPPLVLPKVLLNNKENGYVWMLTHARNFRRTKGIIVNTFVEIEPHAIHSFKVDSQIPPVYPVGPLLDLNGKFHSPSNRPQFDKIMRWLDQQPPSSVIFLCFGSRGSFSVSQTKEIALGLERSGYRFLWSLRQPEPSKSRFAPPSDYSYTNLEEVLPDGFLNRTEGRGLVCGWSPQVEVLAHPATGGFLSHCGWNSILESLWFGVPILVWPLYAEQKLNAFRLVMELGLAVEMGCVSRRNGDDFVKAEDVERGVRIMMDGDNEVRRKVKEIQERSRKAVAQGGSSFVSLGRLIHDVIERIL
ncbi:PREDICTED: anthocyanidin 3-O-glucosyltransferase 2-like [Nelumbo nucifera]|uniref:Glycosyltransferase n=1 Tax=Nelumbo nucifera TaxID=4432 RepID=A0A1U8A6U0_NELNU|nr:PREDICTED: anthocyanidin 3-O-glucosyltransferase 2-like [Nelumbo nucifera]